MGFLAACNWARQNKTNVAGIIGLVYSKGLAWDYANLGAPNPAEMDTAYGGHTAFTPALPTHDPASYGPTDLAGIPMLLVASSDDATLGYSGQQSFAQAMQTGASPGLVTFITQTGGHSLQSFDPTVIKPFLDKYA